MTVILHQQLVKAKEKGKIIRESFFGAIYIGQINVGSKIFLGGEYNNEFYFIT